MPLIIKVESDMFVFSDVVDYMVNLVNLVGVSGAGLALEFRKRCPDHIELYRKACRTKELRFGTVQVLEDVGQSWGMINFPTKDHFANLSSTEDISRSLEALRDLLKTDRYKYSVIGMPMAGTGLGKASYEDVFPLMIDHLGNLDATVFLSLAPEKTDLKPRYLAIVGPLDYGHTNIQKENIDWVIDKTLEHWGMSLSDYTGIISGGYIGVDGYIGGESYLQNVEDTYTFRKTGKPCLVIKPNEVRNSLGANLIAGNVICESAHDIILFKPKKHNNNRMSAMQTWIEADTISKLEKRLAPKRVSISGEPSILAAENDILIQVK